MAYQNSEGEGNGSPSEPFLSLKQQEYIAIRHEMSWPPSVFWSREEKRVWFVLGERAINLLDHIYQFLPLKWSWGYDLRKSHALERLYTARFFSITLYIQRLFLIMFKFCNYTYPSFPSFNQKKCPVRLCHRFLSCGSHIIHVLQTCILCW